MSREGIKQARCREKLFNLNDGKLISSYEFLFHDTALLSLCRRNRKFISVEGVKRLVRQELCDVHNGS